MKVKSGYIISQLTFISFKIETTDNIAAKLIAPDFWPPHVVAKKWQKKTRFVPTITESDTANSDFLGRFTTDVQTI